MIKMFKYSHLTTKIRAMEGKMLTKEDYDQMVLKQSVKEVALYLKNNTYYASALEKLDENDVHRGYIEILLYRAVIVDALKIARYLKGNEKTIYRYVYRKQEIEDLKKILRTLQMGKSLEELDRNTLFISRHSVIDFTKSLKAKNIEQFLETIKNTNFYNILKPLIIDDNTIDIFSAEMALDMYFYRRVMKQVDTIVSGRDKEIVEQVFGLEAEFRNILWIYRGKKYYNTKKEMLYRYLIPYYKKIKSKDYSEMIESIEPDELFNILERGFFGKIINFNKENLENQFIGYLEKELKKNMRIYPFSIAPIIGYIYIKEVEIVNITTIIEGIRYKVSPNEIKKYLAGLAA